MSHLTEGSDRRRKRPRRAPKKPGIQKGGGGAPAGDPELLEAPNALNKIFGLN